MKKKRENRKAVLRQAAPQRMSDEELSAASGAGAAKASTSKAGSLPTETCSFSYGGIVWTYT
jgi:hypothetical protein